MAAMYRITPQPQEQVAPAQQPVSQPSQHQLQQQQAQQQAQADQAAKEAERQREMEEMRRQEVVLKMKVGHSFFNLKLLTISYLRESDAFN